MTYKSKFDSYVMNIEAAREQVATSMEAYSRGSGNLAAVNKANRQLQNAHEAAEECYAGRVSDRRQK
jgi:hypothetical protein